MGGEKNLQPKRHCPFQALGPFLSLVLSYTRIVIGIYLKIYVSTIVSTISKWNKRLSRAQDAVDASPSRAPSVALVLVNTVVQ